RDEPLLLEGIADLHAGSLGSLLLGLAEPGGRQHADSTDAVASRRGSKEHSKVSDTRRFSEDEPVALEHADAHHVHQRVFGVGLVENRLSADRRDTDGVAVARDPADNSLED